MVAAETRQQAEAAAKAIRVSYEPLPAIADLDAALAEDAPVLHPELFPTNVCHELHMRSGDAAQGDDAVRLKCGHSFRACQCRRKVGIGCYLEEAGMLDAHLV